MEHSISNSASEVQKSTTVQSFLEKCINMNMSPGKNELVHMKRSPSLYSNNSIMIIRVPPQLKEPGLPSFLLASDIFQKTNDTIEFNWPGNVFLSKIHSRYSQLTINDCNIPSEVNDSYADSMKLHVEDENIQGSAKRGTQSCNLRDLSPLIQKAWMPSSSILNDKSEPDLRTVIHKRKCSENSSIEKIDFCKSNQPCSNVKNQLSFIESQNKMEHSPPLFIPPIKKQKQSNTSSSTSKRIELNKIHPLLDGTHPDKVKHAIFLDVDNFINFFDNLHYTIPAGTHLWITYCNKDNANYCLDKFSKILPIYNIHQHQQCGTLQGYALTSFPPLMEILHKELPLHAPFTIISPENFVSTQNTLEDEGREVYHISRADFDSDVLQKHLMSDY